MFEGISMELENEIRKTIWGRQKKITASIERLQEHLDAESSKGVYSDIAEIARNMELLSKDLRDMIIDLYGTLQTGGVQPARQLYPALPDVKVREEDGCIVIKMSAMLPFPLKGSVYYLHEKLDMALERFYEENEPPRPYFSERCAVVFIHHYGGKWADLRHLRDYDNVERRCVTNVLASHLLWGDSPKCMVGMDVLAPGEKNYTEIRVMPMPQFRAFVMSEDIEFTP